MLQGTTIRFRFWWKRAIKLLYVFCVSVGLIPQKDYVIAEHILSNDSSRVAGMQGQPQSLDDMTDGQIEDRFYQSVTHSFLIFMLLYHFSVNIRPHCSFN